MEAIQTAPTLQQGLNETVMNKVHRMIDGKAVEIQGASEIEVDFDKELKRLTANGGLLKQESKEVEKILMRNNPEDGVQASLWKLTQAITAHARDLSPERSRELHELSGQLLNRVKATA